VELAGSTTPDQISDLRTTLNASLRDRRLSDAPDIIAGLPDSVAPGLRTIMTGLSTVLLETLVERSEERIVLGGTANLDAVDFPHSVRPVLEALEEQVVLLRLFGEVRAPKTMRIRIGGENEEALRSTSVVASGYGSGDTLLGGIGVLGPTRMDYAGTMSAVFAVARYVGELLAGS
jgi:heat-inducible transcriptional repressor